VALLRVGDVAPRLRRERQFLAREEALDPGAPAAAAAREDEDIVHAPWRQGGLREQGSRTGRCGWITSF